MKLTFDSLSKNEMVEPLLSEPLRLEGPNTALKFSGGDNTVSQLGRGGNDVMLRKIMYCKSNASRSLNFCLVSSQLVPLSTVFLFSLWYCNIV